MTNNHIIYYKKILRHKKMSKERSKTNPFTYDVKISINKLISPHFNLRESTIELNNRSMERDSH